MAHKPCCVIYDEAHEHPAFSDNDLLQHIPKNTVDGKLQRQHITDIGDSLSMSRHFGFDIFLVTQRPAAIRAHILGLIGQHWHMRRLFGLERSWVYVFAEAQSRADLKSVRDDAIQRYMFKFPKHLYQFYVSTEINTHKRNIPKKLIAILCAIAIIPIYGAYRFINSKWLVKRHENPVVETVPSDTSNSSTPKMTNPALQVPSATIPSSDHGQNTQNQGITGDTQTVTYSPSNPYDTSGIQVEYQVANKPRLAGCMMAASTCNCYTEQMTKLNMSQKDCKRYMSGDRPYEYFYESNHGRQSQDSMQPTQQNNDNSNMFNSNLS
jgi:zona occludens toxin